MGSLHRQGVVLKDLVRGQFDRLIPLFGVGRQTLDILTAFDLLCDQSLAVEPSPVPAGHSRAGGDGTPFQFTLTLGSTAPPLQFLGEAGKPGSSGTERLRLSYETLRALARVCGVGGRAPLLVRVLRDLVPDAQLRSAAAGQLWFAVSFAEHAPPALTVHLNGGVGSEPEQWQRLERFADLFGDAGRVRTLASLARPLLAPLGMAVTLRPDALPVGRIYLHAFGAELTVYRALFLQSMPTTDRREAFDHFARHVLGGQAHHPTRSAIFSMEVPGESTAAACLELCAHCAFAHDADAQGRIADWLDSAHLDAPLYRRSVEALSGGTPLSDHGRAALHAYVGIGMRGDEPFASIHLNPAAQVAHLGAPAV